MLINYPKEQKTALQSSYRPTNPQENPTDWNLKIIVKYRRYQYKQQNFCRMEGIEISLNMPQINAFEYKNHVKQINQLVKDLNNFTSNLEGKVNLMLKGQETEFVNSYKQHMYQVENTLKEYQTRIEQYQKKVQHYQNQGVLAVLLKKIQFLEQNEKNLLNSQEKKDKTIRMLKGEINTQKRQIASLQTKIKELLLATTPVTTERKPQQPTFATEINTQPKHTLKSSHSIQYLRTPSPHYQTITNPEHSYDSMIPQTQFKRVNRQLEQLKKKNRELSSVNSKIIEKASSIEEFFVKIVNELKRKINARKKFSECSFQDFKQEDKLELLVKVLSNQEVLQHLYSKIFSRQSEARQNYSAASYHREILLSERGKGETEREHGRIERVVGRLPAISAMRR